MKNYTQLSFTERQQIGSLLLMGKGKGIIANRLGRHRSTIYRELLRNKRLEKGYAAYEAQKQARERHTHQPSKLETNKSLYEYVCNGLEQGWSPEQIVGRIRREKRSWRLCHETIYRYIYNHPELTWYVFLLRQKHRRGHRLRKGRRRAPPMGFRNIQYRSLAVLRRWHFGHWEGDTLRFSTRQKACVTTLVERKSRFVCLRKNGNKSTVEVIGQMKDMMQTTTPKIWRTITFDLGKEFSAFASLEEKTPCRVYFCNPYSPWQRPTNENTNGRLRRFLPRKVLIDSMTQNELDLIASRMNLTPRKCLNYLTPSEVFMHHSRFDCRTSS